MGAKSKMDTGYPFMNRTLKIPANAYKSEVITSGNEVDRLDETLIFNESRHLGGCYMPKKGRSIIADKVDKNRSQLLHSVLKPDAKQISDGNREYVSTFRNMNRRDFQSNTNGILNWSYVEP